MTSADRMNHQDPLQALLHRWAEQAYVAASNLLQLYTQLGDGAQRQRALRIFDDARARLTQGSALTQRMPPLHHEDTEAECATWRSALEAFTGILFFLTMANDKKEPTFGLRGQLTNATRATQAALQGLLCAFPKDMAIEETQKAIHQVIEACGIAFTRCWPEEASSGTIDVLLEAIRVSLQDYLVGPLRNLG